MAKCKEVHLELWYCEFCGKGDLYRFNLQHPEDYTKEEIEKHEAECTYNPKNKRCRACANLIWNRAGGGGEMWHGCKKSGTVWNSDGKWRDEDKQPPCDLFDLRDVRAYLDEPII